MRRGLIFLLIFIVLLVAPTAVRYLQYYQPGGGERTIPESYDVAARVDSVPTPAAAPFVDDPETLGGLVLLDQAHDNAFTLDEIGSLDGRLAARGVELVPHTGSDLATALRAVNAYVVITPLQPFSADEVQAVENFVRRGGRLLMLGDPTRYNLIIEEDFFTFNVFIESDEIPLNSLANSFDIIFNGDYLYNTLENEGNFQNIIATDEGFAEGVLTADLEQIALYGSHSLQVGAGAEVLIAGDDDTWSSATDRPGGLNMAATAADGQVVGIGDIHFLTQPYFTVFDNGRFIAQIADFLAQPIQRDYSVADFPYFFADNINLIYTGSPELGPDAFDEIITLQDSLRVAEKSLTLATADSQDGDAIYLGLYNQAEDVANLLADVGISLMIEPAILTAEEEAALKDEEMEDGNAESETEAEVVPEEDDEEETAEEPEDVIRLIQSDLGNVQMSGTALILLDESDRERKLVVLAASHDGLESTVNRLLDLIPLDGSYALADCLLQDNLALCPTGIADEAVEAELETGGAPEAPEPGDDGEEETEEAGEETEEPEESAEPIEDILGTEDQGEIGIGDSIEGTLPPETRYSWSFQGGPAVIDISVASGESLDAVLELYDSDAFLLEVADSGFTGDDEAIIGADIPDDGEYIIVLRDFFDEGGDFTLTVTESDESASDEEDDGEDNIGSEGDSSIFLFVDDDGEPIGTGITSQTEIEAILADYSVTTWVSTVDGLLTEEALETVSLLIWDSGDYFEPDGFFDEDSNTIFNYLDSGRPVLIIGSSPSLFGDIGLTAVSEVEFTGDDAILLDGFAAGDVLTLDATYEVAFTEILAEDLQNEASAFLLFGSDSDTPGGVIAFAAVDETLSDQRSIFLLFPFSALPDDAQEPLLTNMLTWVGIDAP